MEMMEVYRVTVFVPKDYAEELRQAICMADPLKIDSYEKVMWSTSGVVEQFTPTSGANPTMGSVHENMNIDSVRVEFCIPRNKSVLESVLNNAVFATHPWEVPAIIVDESIIPFKD